MLQVFISALFIDIWSEEYDFCRCDVIVKDSSATVIAKGMFVNKDIEY